MSAPNTIGYIPAKTGQEIGVLFGFAGAMVLAMCGYLLLWKGTQFSQGYWAFLKRYLVLSLPLIIVSFHLRIILIDFLSFSW